MAGNEALAVNRRTNALIELSNAYSRSNAFGRALFLTMHDTPSFGSAIANIAVDDSRNVERLALPKTEIAEAIQNATRWRTFDLIVAAFELHHLSPTENEKVCEAIGKATTSEGTFVIADYALPTVDPEQYEPFIVSNTERNNVLRYGGLQQWFGAHYGWNRDRLANMAYATYKPYVMSESLPGHAAMAVATGDQRIIAATKAALHGFIEVK